MRIFLEHIKQCWFKSIPYTLAHKLAFLQVECSCLGRITLRGLLHDTDKLIMYALLIPKSKVHKLHRSWSAHHYNEQGVIIDITGAIIDWECARYTKPDKPLNARAAVRTYYPTYTSIVYAICDKWNI